MYAMKIKGSGQRMEPHSPKQHWSILYSSLLQFQL